MGLPKSIGSDRNDVVYGAMEQKPQIKPYEARESCPMCDHTRASIAQGIFLCPVCGAVGDRQLAREYEPRWLKQSEQVAHLFSDMLLTDVIEGFAKECVRRLCNELKLEARRSATTGEIGIYTNQHFVVFRRATWAEVRCGLEELKTREQSCE